MFFTLFHYVAYEQSGKFDLKCENRPCRKSCTLQRDWKLFPLPLAAVLLSSNCRNPSHTPLNPEKYEDYKSTSAWLTHTKTSVRDSFQHDDGTGFEGVKALLITVHVRAHKRTKGKTFVRSQASLCEATQELLCCWEAGMWSWRGASLWGGHRLQAAWDSASFCLLCTCMHVCVAACNCCSGTSAGATDLEGTRSPHRDWMQRDMWGWEGLSKLKLLGKLGLEVNWLWFLFRLNCWKQLIKNDPCQTYDYV